MSHRATSPSDAGSARTVIVRQASTGSLRLQPRRRSDALVARLLAPVLDARLARGVAPETGRLLAVRAARLVDPRQRRALAEAWDGVVVRATEPVRSADPRIPVARGAVRAAATEIAALATALRSPSPLSAGDVARAETLLTDGTGPVYTGRGLRTAVEHLLADLALTARTG